MYYCYLITITEKVLFCLTERDLDMMDGSVQGMAEYYLRDSYDQLSSESQMVDGQGRSHRSSRSQTPVARGKTGSRLSLNSGAVVPAQCMCQTHFC